VFNASSLLDTVPLPLKFDTCLDYSTMYTNHVLAEIVAEVSDESKSAKFETLRPMRCEGVKFFIQNSEQRSYHLAVVRVNSKLCVLMRDKKMRDWYSAVTSADYDVLHVNMSANIKVLTTLSEYVKLLFVLRHDRALLLLTPYLLGNEAPPSPPDHGWEELQTQHGMEDQQAMAVARYLNAEGGVNLLEGPPGTGKSHTIATLVMELLLEPSERKIVITCPTNAGLCSIAKKLQSKGCVFTVYAHKDKEEFKDLQDYISDESFERVVLCTMSRCFSLSRKAKVSGVELIVDEAGIASEPLSLIPFMLSPVRCLFVGDIHQLQPHVKGTQEAKAQHYQRSMMERLQLLARDEYGVEVPMLDVCFRFGQEIGDFCNQNSYGGRLQFAQAVTALNTECLPLKPLNWVPHKGWANEDHVNYIEIGVVCDLVRLLKSRPGVKLETDVVVLCFYKAHLEALEKKLQEKRLPVPVHTVDSFQGQERKFVIVSFSRTDGMGFLKDDHRLNMALTRPQACMLLVGNKKALNRDYRSKNAMLRKLFTYVEERLLVKSLEECMVLPAVAGLLAPVDTKKLRNYFDIIQLSPESTFVIKRMEAQHMSTTVNKELMSKALQGNTDPAYRTALLHYVARKYELIQGGPGLELFAALRDFHVATGETAYEPLILRLEGLVATARHAADSVLAASIVIWIKFRCRASLDSVLQAYSDLDERCSALPVTYRTKYLSQWGIVLMKAKRWGDAVHVLSRVAGISDEDVTALNFDDVYNSRCLLAEVLHNSTGSAPLTAALLRQVGGWLERAVALSDKSYSMQRSWAYEMLAGLEMDHKSYTEAVRYAKEALYRHPGNVHAYRTYMDARALCAAKVRLFVRAEHY
jgi:energy-coupling factor transporter ATP-binding protein EcfA2